MVRCDNDDVPTKASTERILHVVARTRRRMACVMIMIVFFFGETRSLDNGAKIYSWDRCFQ
jgi:hypothetical protein